jgi:hypothetical protein
MIRAENSSGSRARADAPDDDDARTESLSEHSDEAATPIRLLDRSSLDIAVKQWDPALASAYGPAVQAEPDAESFARFLWRLDVAVDAAGRQARPSVAPWLRALSADERARRESFRIAAAAEDSGQRTIMEVYGEMRRVR